MSTLPSPTKPAGGRTPYPCSPKLQPPTISSLTAEGFYVFVVIVVIFDF